MKSRRTATSKKQHWGSLVLLLIVSVALGSVTGCTRKAEEPAAVEPEPEPAAPEAAKPDVEEP